MRRLFTDYLSAKSPQDLRFFAPLASPGTQTGPPPAEIAGKLPECKRHQVWATLR